MLGDNYNIAMDVEIDQANLINECISMASTYRSYADLAREARTIVSEKSDLLKIIQAERNIAIREQCANEGRKVTEGIITSMVQSDSQVVNAMKELRDAEATYERLNVAVKSLEMKKSELDNLVKLRCNDYYVDNTVKATQDIASESTSLFNQRRMTPLPNRNSNM